jgi:hypothetical protein
MVPEETSGQLSAKALMKQSGGSAVRTTAQEQTANRNVQSSQLVDTCQVIQ